MTDNEFVAVFRGATPHYLDNKVYSFPLFENPGASKNGTQTHHSNDLKYDTSWDWLMPVVEQITQKECTNPDPNPKYVAMLDELSAAMLRNDIATAFTIVVNIIKWIKSIPF